MSSYPSGLSPQLKQVPEEGASGTHTPSHGGMIVGHEFDMPIVQSYNNQQHTPPTPRGQTPNSNRQRPVSMPPQSYAASSTPTAHANSTAPSESKDRPQAAADETRERRRHKDEHGSSRRSGRRALGDYTLSKTLGAGSMGQVRLATHNGTQEKLAVKILPRVNPNPPPTTNGSSSNADSAATRQAQKDASKETRTLREAALSMLLYHPYICGMREMIIHQHHYYMVFEYVNGGQMLDYIISHGRLRERVARKFARQIGSALMYCHLNNVVHRDLKIENILISQTGNIKIIDFGLSNLYDPTAHLSTFCGSLYFAAPELLSAKVYTGPEVDVWSFGVVIYVLVCGKVPFDDQSMPALHAKIKRGMAEYPVWLSAECKHLLSRMLVTNPTQRATLAEVMSHPWMVRGFMGPPAIHMVHREPLRADELDKQVIKNMKGFEFGTDEEVERKLVGILESESYQRSVQYWERKRSVGNFNGNGNGTSSGSTYNGTGLSNSSLAISFDSNSGKNDYPSTATSTSSTPSASMKKSRRFSGFDYYRRKLLGGATHSGGGVHGSGSDSNSRAGSAEREPVDPTKGFHPLISMYYLAREKLERDRVYGAGQFASSQLSITGDTANANAGSVMTPTEEKPSRPLQYPNPAQPPAASTRKDPMPSTKGKADYSMPLPRLPAPETSHYSGMSYDTTAPVPSPTSPGFAVPRARDPGAHMPSVPPSPTVTAASATGASEGSGRPHVEIDESATLGPKRGLLPRAPPPSTHRRSHSMSQRPTVLSTRWGGMFGGGGSGHATAPSSATDENGRILPEPPRTVGPDTSNFPEIRKPSSLIDGIERDKRQQQSQGLGQGQGHQQEYSSAFSSGATLVRKFGSMLVGGHGGDGGSKRYHGTAGGKRGTILAGLTPSTATTPRPSADADVPEKEKDGEKEQLDLSEKDKETEKEKDDDTTTLATTTTVSPPDAATAGSTTPVMQHTPPTPTSPTFAPSAATATKKSLVPQPLANVHRRAATILDPQGRTTRHERRSSTGAAIMGNSASSTISAGDRGTIGRHRRPSTGYSTTSGTRPFAERLFSPKTSEPASAPATGLTAAEMAERREEEEDILGVGTDGGDITDKEDDERATVKPIFLKGLFSVATTSTKSPNVIKADIRRVLDRMQVQYRETKTGFECIHLPSIDISSIEPTIRSGHGHHQQMTSSTSGDTSPMTPHSRPSIAKKASKLSFGMKRDKTHDKGKERDNSDDKEKEQEATGRPSGGTTAGLTASPSAASSSFFNVTSSHTAVPSGDAQTNGSSILTAPASPIAESASIASPTTPQHGQEGSSASSPPPRSHSPTTAYSTISNKSKVLPPIPRDFGLPRTTSPLPPARSASPLPTGAVDKEVFESMGSSSLSVRFEINVVKVPFLPLHGIQFRRAGGDGWQYQMLARRVLTELKL